MKKKKEEKKEDSATADVDDLLLSGSDGEEPVQEQTG